MDIMTRSKPAILGLAFDDITLEDVVAQLLGRDPQAPFGYVVTPNADHFTRLLRVPDFLPLYRGAMLCLFDSQFLRHVCGWLGLAQPYVVTGSSLTTALLDRLNGQRVTVIGLEDPHFRLLQRRYPGIDFSHHCPPMGLLENFVAFDQACDFVCEAKAPFNFIALGSPLQELMAHAIGAKAGAVGVGLCIGAALQFAAGAAKRAPVWMQRAGLEWLHRLATDPVRLAPRYLRDNPMVLAALAGEAIRQTRRRSRPG